MTVGVLAVAAPAPALAAGSRTAGPGAVVSFTDAVVLAVGAIALLMAGIWFHRATASIVREAPRIIAVPDEDRPAALRPPAAAPAPTAARAAGPAALVVPPLPHAR